MSSVACPRGRIERRGVGRAGALAVTCVALAGCSAGHVDIVSLQPYAIDPPEPVSYRYDADVARWWKDDHGDLNVAMQFDRVLLFSPIDKVTLKLSFVLDGMPAGHGRDYRVGQREIRGLFQYGIQQHRFSSYQGICSVLIQPNGRLRGSFRLWLLHQSGGGLFDLMPRQPGHVLFFGRFNASPDPDGLGQRIRDETESAGWERPEKAAPASQPVRRGAGNVAFAPRPVGPEAAEKTARRAAARGRAGEPSAC